MIYRLEATGTSKMFAVGYILFFIAALFSHSTVMAIAALIFLIQGLACCELIVVDKKEPK